MDRTQPWTRYANATRGPYVRHAKGERGVEGLPRPKGGSPDIMMLRGAGSAGAQASVKASIFPGSAGTEGSGFSIY